MDSNTLVLVHTNLDSLEMRLLADVKLRLIQALSLQLVRGGIKSPVIAVNC